MPICKEKDIAVLAYSPLQQGLLSGRFLKVDDVPIGRRRGKLFSMERFVYCYTASLHLYTALHEKINGCNR